MQASVEPSKQIQAAIDLIVEEGGGLGEEKIDLLMREYGFCPRCVSHRLNQAAFGRDVQIFTFHCQKPYHQQIFAWDIATARQIVSLYPIDKIAALPPEKCREVYRPENVEEQHIDHVDFTAPALAVIEELPGEGTCSVIIDGTHRVARAARLGIACPIVMLDPADARRCQLAAPPDTEQQLALQVGRMMQRIKPIFPIPMAIAMVMDQLFREKAAAQATAGPG